MNELITVTGALIGVLIGGGISFVVNNSRIRHESTLDNRNRILNKLETAHKIISVIDNNFHTVKSTLFIKRSHGIDFFPNSINERAELGELKMIISFYAPTLLNDLKNLENETLKFSSFFGQAITATKLTSETENKLFKNLEVATNNITLYSEKLQGKLIKIADSHLDKKT